MVILTALYDACVFYPAPLRDLLLHLALTKLFRARWTSTIHDEWMRNLLVQRPDLRPERLERTRQLIDASIPDCLVNGYEELLPTLQLPDPDDRHVLAAAIRGRADVIVTYNLADFPSAALAPHGIRAQHPDEFVLYLLDLDPDAVCGAVKRQRENLRNPPQSVEQLLETLRTLRLTRTVTRLREVMDQL